MRHFRLLVCAVVLVVPVFGDVAFAAEPGREFSAEAVVNSREGRNRMLVTFVVQRFTSVEELQNLAGVLENGGQFALLSVLEGRRDGQLRLGATNMPIALVVAEPQGRGFRYLFLTPRRIQVNEEMLGEESLNYPFGIAAFEVDRFGRGEGRIHVAAALSIDATGYVEIEDYDGVDGRVERIKQVR
jgi:hypothetical protein